MKKVIISYQNDLVHVMTKLDEADLAFVDWNSVPEPYFVVDDAPVFNNPIFCLRVNTQTNPPSVSAPAELIAAYNRPRLIRIATTWKKDQLASVDWTQVMLTATDRKIIMGVELTENEKTDIYNEWELAGSPGYVPDVQPSPNG